MDDHEISGWSDWLTDGEVALALGDVDRSIMLLAAVRDGLRQSAGEDDIAALAADQREQVVRLALRLLRAWRVASGQAALRN
ncbi:MAG TPA: hypothetical protein VEL07_09890 [Planctomycetota bacterium]|nr:hypothetical protein [Planctomycetota bacterium]